MRRPLSLVCFAFTAAVLLLLLLFRPEPYPLAGLQGRTVTVEGEVYRKEYKNISFLIYLKNPIIVNSDSNLIGQSDQNHIPYNKKQNKVIRPEGILCYMEGSYEPMLGSTVRVRGRAEAFSEASNDGQFNMRRYEKIQHMDFKMTGCRITRESEEFSGRREFLFKLRRKGETVYSKYLTPEKASIMNACVFGNKAQLNEEIRELYQNAGISHLLVISGLHISIIGMGLHKILKKFRLPSIPAAVICILLMIQYGDMTGMGTSSYRAVFMFSLHLLAGLFRRTYDLLTAMALSAVCLLLDQPMYVFDTGFLLSFGAIAAIGMVYPALGGGGERKGGLLYRRLYGIKNSLLASVSVFITTFPIMASSFYQVSMFSVFLNLLVIPLMSFLLLSGLLLLPASIAGGGFVLIMAAPCNVIMDVYKWLCEAVKGLEGNYWITGKAQTWQILLYISGLLLLIVFNQKIGSIIKYLGISLIMFIMTSGIQNGLTVYMLDVGQGDCLCIRTETGAAYLVDGGSSSEREIGKYKIIPFLKSHKITELEAVFVSHSDEDHINGIRELLKDSTAPGSVKIRKLILPGILEEFKDDKYKELVKLSEEKNVELIYFNKGSLLLENKLQIECLHPSRDFEAETANSYSMVLSLSYGEFTMLFTGDVEGRGEEKLTELLDKRRREGRFKNYEILKTAHHGSGNSTQNGFLENLGARLALISCGRNNIYGHPSAELLRRLKIYRINNILTQECGQITVRTNGKAYRILRFLDR